LKLTDSEAPCNVSAGSDNVFVPPKKKALVRALKYKSAITIAFILTAGFLMSLELEVRTIVNMYQNLEMYSM
jgi:hypothetical protein